MVVLSHGGRGCYGHTVIGAMRCCCAGPCQELAKGSKTKYTIKISLHLPCTTNTDSIIIEMSQLYIFKFYFTKLISGIKSFPQNVLIDRIHFPLCKAIKLLNTPNMHYDECRNAILLYTPKAVHANNRQEYPAYNKNSSLSLCLFV